MKQKQNIPGVGQVSEGNPDAFLGGRGVRFRSSQIRVFELVNVLPFFGQAIPGDTEWVQIGQIEMQTMIEHWTTPYSFRG